eukprot:TRINITY_DN10703_c0_g1_i8.p1 TRINITY_DN10703_c0_g1~~TRINITY_DN10703_c0_g1_i8.p1  ORF type:complete len:513 (+),score=75.27 TRINITY_DN10703_c0_g1_i8:145-1539(+)
MDLAAKMLSASAWRANDNRLTSAQIALQGAIPAKSLYLQIQAPTPGVGDDDVDDDILSSGQPTSDANSVSGDESSRSCSSASLGASSAASLLRSRRGVQDLRLDTRAVAMKTKEEAKGSAGALEELQGKYDVFEVLGQGCHGVVKRARRRSDGKAVALKIVRTVEGEIVRACREEYNKLRSNDHPCIIKALEFVALTDCAVMVMEFFNGSSLEEAVLTADRFRLPEVTARHVMRSLLDVLVTLHGKGMIHRDIKPQNILVSKDCHSIKVVDFNTVHEASEGTLDYLSPEAIRCAAFSAKGDVWAAALCLHFMLCGRLPVKRSAFRTVAAFREHIANTQVGLSRVVSKRNTMACQMCLLACLALEEAARPNALEAMKSPWFLMTEESIEMLTSNMPNFEDAVPVFGTSYKFSNSAGTTASSGGDRISSGSGGDRGDRICTGNVANEVSVLSSLSVLSQESTKLSL